TKEYAKRIVRLVDSLPDSISGRTLASQVMRSGTSVAANYRSLCRSKSLPDFINKTSIIEEEADETCFWLELIVETGKLPVTKVAPLLKESNELVSIFVASRRTARKRDNTRKSRWGKGPHPLTVETRK
ncbi:MAG TPA: four helix bundle protein, partial [Chthoniobacterales bacterium]